MDFKEPETRETSVKPDPETSESSKLTQASKVVVLADLNVNPPESDVYSPVHALTPDLNRLSIDDHSQERCLLITKESDVAEGDCKRKLEKCRSKSSKLEPLDCLGEADSELSAPGAPVSREEKVSSLKTGLVHVARKMPKNAHAHFMLGLMYQRLGQPQKAISSYEKAAEILLRCEPEIARPELLSLVQIHHAQCVLLDHSGDCNLDKELEPQELNEILVKLKEALQSDIRQANIWNTVGLILLKNGCLQSAVSVLSSLLALSPGNHDCLATLGIAYLQSGNLELAEKCFQDLILRDQNHPSALLNYAAILLCKCGSVVPGAGANLGETITTDQGTSPHVAKECLLAALKSEPKAAHLWASLANAYFLIGDHRSSSKCLEKAAKLEPNCMSTRYAVAVQRIKDAERSQHPSDELSWAGNEMASILREGESVPVDLLTGWAGLAMVHKTQHEIVAAFEADQKVLVEMEERAIFSLKQAISEDPDDAVQWHQLGLHSLCSQQFRVAQKYLKMAIARFGDCSYAWSNLAVSLQLSEERLVAEQVYKRALASATMEQACAIFSNLGNLYRQQREYELAKAMFSEALKLRSGYAPAFNNLGLVFVAEGRIEEARFCFDKALQADPLLDAAKSNMIKTLVSEVCDTFVRIYPKLL